jgi:hypothetical protein
MPAIGSGNLGISPYQQIAKMLEFCQRDYRWKNSGRIARQAGLMIASRPS